MKRFILITMVFVLSGMLYASASHAATYYVATTGSDSTNPGTQALPWATIGKGATTAVAGDTVYIKGGDYGHEHVVVANTGTSSAPIIFQGYDGTPILDGEDWTGNGIYLSGKSYITLKNLRVKNFRGGFWVDGESSFCTLDGCVADSCTNIDYAKYGYDGYGIVVQKSSYCVVKNCSATDNGGDNFFLSFSDYCTVQNCQAYSKQTVSNEFITDYYMVLAFSSNNVIRDCVCEDINGSYKGNHGFIIKDNPKLKGIHSTGNKFINCTAKKLEEGFAFSHEAYGNLADSCYADNTGKNSDFNHCLMVRDGAYSNTFSNCRAVGLNGAVCLYDGGEGGNVDQFQDGNSFINCTFEGGTYSIFLRNSTNTTFSNCAFSNSTNLFRFAKNRSGMDANSGTVLKSCTLSGVANQYDIRPLGIPWTYSRTDTEAGYSDMDDVAITHP